MSTIKPIKALKYRTVWISDIHLGYKGCKADFLLDFLQQIECDYIYLVGDIIDIWQMNKNNFYWPGKHSEIVRTILYKANNKTKVIYIPGNHDEIFRAYDGMNFNNIEIHNNYIHITIDGRKLLITHGDEFDKQLNLNGAISYFGEKGNDLLLYINRYLYEAHRMMGCSYWSLSAFIKDKVKDAANITQKFQHAATRAAKVHNVDGIVCGHMHHTKIIEIDGKLYCNDGDWVENCSAMVEHHDGTLELISYRENLKSLLVYPPEYITLPESKIA